MQAILPERMHGANKHSWTRAICGAPKALSHLGAWVHRSRNGKRRRKQSAESAVQLAGQSHRSMAVNRAFSAVTYLDDSNLGRCPRLPVTCAFGAKHPQTGLSASRHSKSKTETEVKRAEIFELMRVRIHTVVQTNRADRQLVTQPTTNRVAHIV